MKIVHVDDNREILDRYGALIRSADLGSRVEVTSIACVDEFMALLSTGSAPDLVILDLHFGDGKERLGISLIEKTHIRWPQVPIIAASEYSDSETIMAVQQAGIDDFVQKINEKSLIPRIKAALEAGKKASQIEGFVGKTMNDIARRVPKILSSAIRCIHVVGPTGSGKEVVADCFRRECRRPFRQVNCGAIAESLIENALFGHKKGSYTGAASDQKGVFEEADGGFVFLDEVADLSPHAQVALLRVIENSEVTPVGANSPIKVNVRIISATNKDLMKEVEAGRFRADLLQRLSERLLALPPLSERKEEVPDLINHFCKTLLVNQRK